MKRYTFNVNRHTALSKEAKIHLTILALATILALLVLALMGDYDPQETQAIVVQETTTPRLFPDPCELDSVECGVEALNGSLGYRTVTAYTSSPDETDSTPFITASGTTTRRGIVATNELPFGTRVLIAGQEYVVEDRTNSRYQNRYDIWMPTKAEAFDWGRKTVEITVVETGA